MSNNILTSYIRNRMMKKILAEGGIVTYSKLKDWIGDRSGRLDYHFNILIEEGFLERTQRGHYRIVPAKIELLRERFDIITPIALIGGIGQDKSLLTDLSSALREVSIVPQYRVIITSHSVGNEIATDPLFDQSKMSLITLDYQTILRENPPIIQEKIDEWYLQNYMDYSIIGDLTGGTKPITIAVNMLGKKYNWKLCYFSSRKIIWL